MSADRATQKGFSGRSRNMPRGKKDGTNKMEAVRQVITKHGKDVMPVDIVKLVKEEHGVVMNTDMASTYKSTALKQLGLSSGRKRGRKKKGAAKAAEAGVVAVA